MGPLRLAAALLLSYAPMANAEPVDDWRSHIGEASARFGIPQIWIRRVIQAESGGRAFLQRAPATSRAGAMGLMQLMPGTFDEMRRKNALGTNPYDPRDNILAGAAYLRTMYERFGYPGLFGAYNAGPKRFARYLAGKARLPPQTREYLAKVDPGSGPKLSMPPRLTMHNRAAARSFTIQRGAAAQGVKLSGDPEPQALFAIVQHASAEEPR